MNATYLAAFARMQREGLDSRESLNGAGLVLRERRGVRCGSLRGAGTCRERGVSDCGSC